MLNDEYSEGIDEKCETMQEESFKEFLSRPENQPILEKHQRREVKQAIQLQEKMNAMNFRSKVLEADYDAQIAIAPFLKNKMLKRVVQTFANDPNGDFEKWAKNPRVIEMLRSAQKMMDEGRVTEEEMEEFILRMMRDPSYEHHAEFEAKTKQVARLPTDQLVQALNEHVRSMHVLHSVYSCMKRVKFIIYKWKIDITERLLCS